MKNRALQFYSAIVYLASNIVSFYLINPTESRYRRLRAIIKGAKIKNESIPDNKYMRINFEILETVDEILFNVRLAKREAKAEHIDDSRLMDRKATFTFGTCCLSLKSRA